MVVRRLPHAVVQAVPPGGSSPTGLSPRRSSFARHISSLQFDADRLFWDELQPSPFLSLGIYETAAVNVQAAAEPADVDAWERRIATHLLRKNLTGLYPIGYSS